MIKYLNDEDFYEEVKKELVLVDFYADWCGPCKALGATLETIDTIDILKVNVDTHQDLAARYGVMSIPTIILFKNGVESAKAVGLMSRDMLLDWIEKNK